jgi:glycosyltransferase involved in cell wall biosynthesis
MRRIVAISDYCSQVPPEPAAPGPVDSVSPRRVGPTTPVVGGYLERLPLAAVRSGLVEAAEIWSFTGADHHPTGYSVGRNGLGERRFRADGHSAPYGSAAVLKHIAAVGEPEILCIWGLGVTAEILEACPTSIKIYNSLDVDALRVPVEVSRCMDIFLVASAAQGAAVRARHPDASVAELPVGPEFASSVTFFPLSLPKDFDVIYVAAAQPYKRHDILFEALAALPRTIRTLCVMGYGEDADALRADAVSKGIDVTFIGPPGVSHAEVNQLMNRARIGVVCGVNDGAPAILTEYMLAGLPVLANKDLACGLQYIRPDTGRTASAERFGTTLWDMLCTPPHLSPRDVVLRNWTWPHSMDRLMPLIRSARNLRRRECLA